MVTVEEFTREYSKAISEGYAAVFAGAGLSRGSGYVGWKDLILPLAKDIGLDANKENDLIAVAQYYKNERGSRSGINQKILEEFTKDVEINENVRILTRLPISTYWTTNYDELLEEGLQENNRKADVKITQENLAFNLHNRDAIIYKMHGDVRSPDQAVLTKDDYEMYPYNRPLFRTALQADLISKTFLFIGFSFEDPNLDYVLAQIRLLLGESHRDHYCFFERIKRIDGELEDDYQYKIHKQDLRINDLKRYGIHAILLEDYNEITNILLNIEQRYLSKSIFISGSIAKYDSVWTEERVNDFAFSLAKQLVQKNYRIVSGFGIGIGSPIINGALEEIMKTKYKHIDEYLYLRPFPQKAVGSIPQPDLWRSYREDMLKHSGISIFMFGNKESENEIVVANGMLQEFQIAKETKTAVIPIGATGWAAKQISDEIQQDINRYPYLEKHLKDLCTCTDIKQLISWICEIIDSLQNVDFYKQ